MAQRYSGHYPRSKVVKPMRYVVKNEDASLSIVLTSGQEPPNAICKAHDEWSADLISYDEVSKIIYIDPVKVKEKERQRIRELYEVKVTARMQFLNQHWPMAKLTLLCIGCFVLGWLMHR